MCLNCRKAVICRSRISSLVYSSNLEALAGNAQCRAWWVVWASLCISVAQLPISVASPTQRRWEVLTPAPGCRWVWYSPSLAGWFVNVLNSRALGGLTTERGVLFLYRIHLPKEQHCLLLQALVCFTFERLHPPDKPLCVLRTFGGRKAMKLVFFSLGAKGQLYKIIQSSLSKWAFSTFLLVGIS